MNSIKLIIYLTFSMIISFSCVKARKYGCRMKGASNYDPKAKVDDGSCIYSSQGVFVLRGGYSSYFTFNNISSVKVFLDDKKLLADQPLENYSSYGQKDCTDESRGILFKKEMIGSTQAHLRVTDQKDSLLQNRIIEMPIGCNIVSINF